MLTFFKKLSLFQKIQLGILILLLIGLPLFYFISKTQQDLRQRASASASLEVEDGQITGNTVQVIPDETASGGKHILFNAIRQ